MLSGIEAEGTAQISLLPTPSKRGEQFMDVLDRMNANGGKQTHCIAVVGSETA